MSQIVIRSVNDIIDVFDIIIDMIDSVLISVSNICDVATDRHDTILAGFMFDDCNHCYCVYRTIGKYSYL